MTRAFGERVIDLNPGVQMNAASLAVLLLVAALGGAPVQAGNLIVNGDAETGDLTGWTDALGNGFTLTSGLPAAPVFEGDWSFWGGVFGPSGSWISEIYQDVDLSANASGIDAASIYSFFSAQGRSNFGSGETDSARIILEFRDVQGSVLDTFDTGTVLPVNDWNLVVDSRLVPVGTRTLRVRLIASRQKYSSTDAFFDDLKLLLAQSNSGAYCVGKENSAGCTPSIAASGTPGFSEVGGFDLLATNELNQKNGLLFYGFAAAAVPFQGGTLCVQPPLRRTTIQNSGGNVPPAADCSGSYTFDFNAWMQSGQAPNVAPGQPVFAQYWSRDPGSPQPSGLTNAVSFTPSS